MDWLSITVACLVAIGFMLIAKALWGAHRNMAVAGKYWAYMDKVNKALTDGSYRHRRGELDEEKHAIDLEYASLRWVKKGKGNGPP